MLGEILRIIRIANDLSVKAVAEQLGVSPTFISEVEHGKKNVTIESLKELAKIFNIPTSYILVLQELKESLGLSFQRLLYLTLAYYVYQFQLETVNEQNIHTKIEEINQLVNKMSVA